MLINHDLGAALYKTWSEEQRSEEIVRLIKGFRAGLPVGILCKMVETIAGNREQARGYLQQHLTVEERQAAVAGEPPSMQQILREFLL